MQNNETLSQTWVISGLRRPRWSAQCGKHLDIKRFGDSCWKMHTIRNETARGSHKKAGLRKKRQLTKNTCSFTTMSHCFVQSHTLESQNMLKKNVEAVGVDVGRNCYLHPFSSFKDWIQNPNLHHPRHCPVAFVWAAAGYSHNNMVTVL